MIDAEHQKPGITVYTWYGTQGGTRAVTLVKRASASAWLTTASGELFHPEELWPTREECERAYALHLLGRGAP